MMDEMVMVAEDAVVMRVKDHFGHLCSLKFGRIYFTQSDIENVDEIDIHEVAPGVAAKVWATKNCLQQPPQCGMSDTGSSAFPDIQWRATRVQLSKIRSPIVREGYGLLSQAHSGYGFLDSEEFSNTLFVPGFAASNNLMTETCGFQIPELKGRRVHFLCIPNPKRKFDSYFVIALHPFHDGKCADVDGMMYSSSEHWLRPPHTDALIAGTNILNLRDTDIVHAKLPDKVIDMRCWREVRDAIVICCNKNSGLLYSPRHGRIHFDAGDVQSTDLPTIGCTASAVTKQSGRHVAVAREVFITRERSAFVSEGVGWYDAAVMCGVVQTPDELLHAPLWASDVSSDRLAEGRVHYLVVEWADRKRCILQVHPLAAECATSCGVDHWAIKAFNSAACKPADSDETITEGLTELAIE